VPNAPNNYCVSSVTVIVTFYWLLTSPQWVSWSSIWRYPCLLCGISMDDNSKCTAITKLCSM